MGVVFARTATAALLSSATTHRSFDAGHTWTDIVPVSDFYANDADKNWHAVSPDGTKASGSETRTLCAAPHPPC